MHLPIAATNLTQGFIFRQNKNKLIAQKDLCMESLSKLVPLADAALELTSLAVPQASWARTAKNIVSLLMDLSYSGGVRSGNQLQCR